MENSGGSLKNIVIIGAGGVGREAALIVKQINDVCPTWNLLGFIDDDKNRWGEEVHGIKILGGMSYLKSITINTSVIVAISSYKAKKNIVQELEGKFSFATLIHPRVLLHDFMTVGFGTIIYEGAILSIDIEIGNHVLISPKCGIGHNSVIKDYASLLWNVNISGSDTLEEGTFVGSGATLVQEISIGREALIGAGAVVLKDVPANATAVGVPARIIKKEDKYEEDIIYNHG